LARKSVEASTGGERNGVTAEPASRPAAVEERTVAAPVSHLNPEFRFETFITGPSNRLPWAATRTIIEGESRSYNPLYIHGGVGLGKTHLLQAVTGALAEKKRSGILYVPCEQFINHFIAAVEKHGLEAFRQRYRNCDALIVDDVHLLAQKERTQEEFLHTFNTLYNGGRQIILSGDTEPGSVAGLSERLASRFKWGLVCELGSPEFATRESIVRAKAQRLEQPLPEEVVRFVAESVRASVRELEGAVTRVVGHAALSEVPPSLDLAQTVLKDVVISNRRRVTIENIAAVITERYGVRLSELQGKRRTQAIVVPRQLCMYLARRLTGKSLETIGGYFGGRDHSTVLYAVDRIRVKLQKDGSFNTLVEDITGEVLRRIDR
jgi:chromosomal replication initiator protein